MKITTIIILLMISPIALLAQGNASIILVRNAGIVNGKQTISIKWYTKELYYDKGVNIYRRQSGGNEEWIRINSLPIAKLSDLPPEEFLKDTTMEFFTTLVKEAKKEDLQGLILVNVLVKSFESEVFSKFLGIQYDDEVVKEGERYQYKIMKIQNGEEVNIGESLAITAGVQTVEDPLKEISVKADTNKVKIKWKPEEQRFYGVNIYRTDQANTLTLKVNANPIMISRSRDSTGKLHYPDIFFMEDTLKIGKYIYRIAGVDFFGKETRMSEPFEVEIKDYIPPLPPQDLRDSVNNLDVVLSWRNNAKDAVGFNVYRSIKSEGPYKKINSTLLPLITISFKDKVEKAGTYYYYVTSVDPSGNEGKSDLVFTEVHDIIPPLKPVGLEVRGDTGKVYLRWKKNKEEDLAGYLIYRTVNKNNKNNFVLLNSNPIKEASFTDKLPANAKNKFLYKIIAIDSSYNKSEASDVAIVQMPDIFPPEKPHVKNIHNVEKSIVIEWIPNKEEDLKGYEIYRASSKQTYIKLNPELLLKNTFSDKTVETGMNYIYYLVAVDSMGNKSEPSNLVKGMNNFKVTIKSPEKVKASYRKEQKDIHISWKYEKSEHISGCVIYKEFGKTGVMLPLTGKLNNNEYYDKDVKKGETYCYEIRAYSKTGDIYKSEKIKIIISE